MASINKRTRTNTKGETYSHWEVRYRDPAGASRRKAFRTKAQAEAWLITNEASKQEGKWRDPNRAKVPFGVAAEQWLATKSERAPTYRRDLKMLLQHQLLPTFGNVPIGAIDATMVEDWLAKLRTAGLSPKRRREALAVLRQVLKRSGFTVTDVEAPKVKVGKRVILSVAEVELLAEAITPPFGTLVRFMAWTGVRPEEATALRLRHYDQLHGTVRVEEAAPLLEGKLAFGPTKTGKPRVIHLPGFLRRELEGYLEARGELGPEAFLFTMPRGGPLRENRFVADHFRPALRRAGLRPMRAYDLRHTAASLAIREGANVLTVSKLLGHAKPSLTLDVYADLFGDELEALAKVLDAAHARERGPNVAPAVVLLRETAGQEG